MTEKLDIKKSLRCCGANVTIYSLAKIVNPQVIEIGDHSQIDDYTFINGGKGLTIGKHVHIASFASIAGDGTALLGDYVAVSSGARIFTGTNIYQGAWSMSAAAPKWMQRRKTGHVEIERFAFIGANSVVLPRVTIGEGAVIGSMSLVTKDIDPWSINVGIPCKKIAVRPKPSKDFSENLK